MNINKLLTVVSSGSDMPLFDLSNSTDVKKENVRFTNLHDLFISVASHDLTVLDNLGDLHEAKEGDYIIKSNCRKIYFVLSKDSNLGDMINKVNEIEKSREKMKEKSMLIDSNEEDVCCDSEPSEIVCASNN